jgi:L-threonylcarbamoyladenylate synthase
MVVSMSSNIYIYPTDTVWGIGGVADNLEVYKKISEVKGSALNKPLSLLFTSIDQLREYVDVKESLLEVISTLKNKEITFGVNKDLFKLDLPELPFSETEFVCFRILPFDYLNKIVEEIDGPIITTSLNKKGETPIVNEADAHLFWKKYAQDCLFVSESLEHSLSGNSSTIILFLGNNYKVLREGSSINEIVKTLNDHGIYA